MPARKALSIASSRFVRQEIEPDEYGTQNGMGSDSPEWLDTVNVPYGGSVDVIMDFTDPLIRGVSRFHCHLLSHEDKGMMAKI
jgi:FtsP/CotA-like multicopper oxidase with cupredoxin domain